MTAGTTRASVLVTSLYFDGAMQAWCYALDGAAPKMLPGYWQAVPRDVILMAVCVAENARTAETLKADGMTVHRSVTRRL